MGIRIVFYSALLGIFFVGLNNQVSAITTTPTPTAPPACALKWQGDADCKADIGGKAITLLDFEVWRKEFFGGCSAKNTTGCGTSDDGDTDLMDANLTTSALRIPWTIKSSTRLILKSGVRDILSRPVPHPRHQSVPPQ